MHYILNVNILYSKLLIRACLKKQILLYPIVLAQYKRQKKFQSFIKGKFLRKVLIKSYRAIMGFIHNWSRSNFESRWIDKLIGNFTRVDFCEAKILGSCDAKVKLFHFEHTLRTRNCMFGKVIWNKLPECIFTRVIQNFEKSQGWFIPKIAQTKHVVTGESHQKQ